MASDSFGRQEVVVNVCLILLYALLLDGFCYTLKNIDYLLLQMLEEAKIRQCALGWALKKHNSQKLTTPMMKTSVYRCR